jgi:lipopolysaccharide transport system ATP-binding protein
MTAATDRDRAAPVVAAEDLGKSFKLYRRPVDRLVEALTGRPRHSRVTAVDGISFALARGEALGILGRNGAGKSTLLKLLAGVLVPDQGRVEIHGRITGLLELGTGFEPEISGRGNIVNNGLLLGLSREEIAAKIPEIIAFSELEAVIDDPIKTYSSGMQMRLGFAVAAHADPACLVIDEALAVGDAPFQAKCRRFLRDFRQAGGAIIMVSHDLDAMQTFCDRAMVVDGGRVAFTGPADEAIAYYNRTLADLATTDATMQLSAPGDGAQSRDQPHLGSVTAVSARHGATILRSGDDLCVEARVQAGADRGFEGHVAVDLLDRFGQRLFGTSTRLLGARPLQIAPGGTEDARIIVACRLQPGKYVARTRLEETDTEAAAVDVNFELAGIKGPVFAGACSLPARFTIDPEAPVPARDQTTTSSIE